MVSALLIVAYLFCPRTSYGSRVSLTGEEEEEEEKEERRKKRMKMMIFDFFLIVFSASIKLNGNQRTYMYSRQGLGFSINIHFVDLEVSSDVLSPLPIVMSKPPSSLQRDRYPDL